MRELTFVVIAYNIINGPFALIFFVVQPFKIIGLLLYKVFSFARYLITETQFVNY